MVLLYIIAATLVVGIVAFVGAFSLFINDKILKKILIILIALSAGTLLSGALFHLLAESILMLDMNTSFTILLVGFCTFFMVERFLHWHHCHEGKCDVHAFNYLILIGDGVHNFIDGLVIAASFIVSIPFGTMTTLLIIGHEIPQELGNFGALVYGGFGKKKALFYNFGSQLTAVIGGIVGYFISTSVNIMPYLLPFAAGGFLYIAASDLIPELHKETNLKKSLISFVFFVLGVVFMVSMKLFFGGV